MLVKLKLNKSGKAKRRRNNSRRSMNQGLGLLQILKVIRLMRKIRMVGSRNDSNLI